VYLSYPENWQSLPQEERSRIAREVALAMGPYLTFTMTTCMKSSPGTASSASACHRVRLGVQLGGLLLEPPGHKVASKALLDREHPYDEAMTIALDEEMAKLGVQSAKYAKQMSESVYDSWYKGRVSMFVDLRRRNFDIGLDDGLVTPVLLPNAAGCEGPSRSRIRPDARRSGQVRFAARVEIVPREWERNKVLRIVYPDKKGKRIIPTEHFPIIMARSARRPRPSTAPRWSRTPSRDFDHRVFRQRLGKIRLDNEIAGAYNPPVFIKRHWEVRSWMAGRQTPRRSGEAHTRRSPAVASCPTDSE
jgi:hypothetical protein